MQKIIKCFYKAIENLINHQGIEYAGYLSFLTILSLFPALILLVVSLNTILEFINTNHDIQRIIGILFSDTELSGAMTMLKPRIKEIIAHPPQSILGVAAISMLWTASSIVEAFRVALNTSYRVKTPPKYIIRRLTSILQFLFIVSAIILAITIAFLFNIMSQKVNSEIMQKSFYKKIYIQNALSIFVTFLGILWIYAILPDKKQKIRDVLPGAVLVVFLLTVSVKIFGFYTNRFTQLGAIYGSLEGTIIALLFFYMIHLCIIYGAEFNHALHEMK